jgi:ribosomal protein S18 acetylase RimI-like enzyme
MAGTDALDATLGARAREWQNAQHDAVCDVQEAWAHGTVVRASRYPTYYNFNVVRVEREPAMDAAELAAFADGALDGLEHRRLDFEHVDAGRARRGELERMGWKTTSLVWMHHGDPAAVAAGEGIEVEQAPYEAADELRLAWHLEDFAGSEYEAFSVAAREVAETRDVRLLIVRERGNPIAYAQLERSGGGAEITQVYVHPEHRGEGRGTAMTRAAIAAAGDVADLWIIADDEDRPKRLYERLGFQPVWRTMEFLWLR